MAKKRSGKAARPAAKRAAKKAGKARPAAAPSKRAPGRPAAGERVVGPEELARIEAMYLRRASLAAIAEALGVSERTVRHHVDTHLRPRWEAESQGALGEELARVQALEAAAWRAFETTAEAAWLHVVQWCVEWRSKVAGHYAPKQLRIDAGGAFRVAGASIAEVDRTMLARLAQRLAEQKRYETALKQMRDEG